MEVGWRYNGGRMEVQWREQLEVATVAAAGAARPAHSSINCRGNYWLMAVINDSAAWGQAACKLRVGRVPPRGGPGIAYLCNQALDSSQGREFPEDSFSRFEPLNHREATSNLQHPRAALRSIIGCWAFHVGCWLFPRLMEREPRRAQLLIWGMPPAQKWAIICKLCQKSFAGLAASW